METDSEQSLSHITENKVEEEKSLNIEDNEKKEDKSIESNISFMLKKPNKQKIKKKKEEKAKKENSKNNIKSDDLSKSSHKIKKENNADDIIEIDEKNSKPNPLKEKKKIKKIKKVKSQKTIKGKYINGYGPFTFFEREKFKEINSKDIKPSEFVKQLSLQWKNMTEEQKIPYIKSALEYKEKNDLSQSSENPPKFQKKKRKRSANEKEKKKECFLSYNNENESNSSVGKKKNNNITEDNGYFLEDDSCNEFMNEYMNTVFVPFVENSYEFFKDKKIIKSK